MVPCDEKLENLLKDYEFQLCEINISNDNIMQFTALSHRDDFFDVEQLKNEINNLFENKKIISINLDKKIHIDNLIGQSPRFIGPPELTLIFTMQMFEENKKPEEDLGIIRGAL